MVAYIPSATLPTAYHAVLRLAEEHPGPRWLRVVRAALTVARRLEGAPFAGRWVLLELAASGDVEHRPGLRILVRFGILRKEGESSRGGNRAYYVMPDQDGVEAALNKLGY